MLTECAVQVGAGLGVHDQREQPASTYCFAITSGVYTIRWASNGTEAVARRGDHVGAEREVGDELAVHHVPLDQVDPGRLEAATSSPSLEKSAGRTDGAIWIGRLIEGAT
jgi:hypothetical protein